jgi:peptidyl-prolyl cis-trans isomerase C
MIRTILVLLAVVALGLLWSGCSEEESDGAAGQTEGTQLASNMDMEDETMAVKVNGHVITKGEIAQQQEMMMQQFGRGMDPQQMEQMKDTIWKQAMESSINRVLIEQAIDSQNIEATEEEIEAKIEELRANFDSDEVFQQRLQSMGMDEARLRQETAMAIKLEKLLDRHAGEMSPVTDADARSHYNENINQFQQPEQIKASHILIKADESATEAERELARKEAESVLGQIRQGADFAALAKEHSGCPSGANGGDLGYFGRGQMVPPFEEAAFALQPGDISDIVETRFGYHIIKVTDKKEAETVAFEDMKDNIKSYLDAQMRQEAMAAYTQELREGADIEYAQPPE